MNAKPICALDDCDRIAWGDEAYCRRHLHVAAPSFTPVVRLTGTVVDDGIEIFHPPATTAADTNPAPAEPTEGK